MRKMGWREGEGLGKNKEGSVEPIMVDFKTDRKGESCPRNPRGSPALRAACSATGPGKHQVFSVSGT